MVIRVDYETKVILVAIQYSFFLSSYKIVILVFALVRKDFLSIYKIIILIFALLRTAFFSLYKMVDSENSSDNYNTLKTRIGTLIKNSEILKFVLHHFKAKAMCQNVIKIFPFAILYVPDRYKTQEMCDKVILENGGMLKFIPDGYKNQTMCYNLLLIGLMHSNLSSVATCPIYPIKQYLSFCNTISSWDICDKVLILALLYLNLSLIDIRLKKCMLKLFPKNLFS